VGIIREGGLVKVDEVASFKDIQQHDVEISFISPSSPEWFRNIPGVLSVLTVTPGHGTQVLHLTQ
jgi:hypothetical protein